MSRASETLGGAVTSRVRAAEGRDDVKVNRLAASESVGDCDG